MGEEAKRAVDFHCAIEAVGRRRVESAGLFEQDRDKRCRSDGTYDANSTVEILKVTWLTKV